MYQVMYPRIENCVFFIYVMHLKWGDVFFSEDNPISCHVSPSPPASDR